MQVTLFHYRKTGNRSSPILLGLEVPMRSEEALRVVIEVFSSWLSCMLMEGCRQVADWLRSSAGILRWILQLQWFACVSKAKVQVESN